MEEQGRVVIPIAKITRKKDGSRMKGPLRLTRLCMLSIILPGILIAGPLYLRYRVYSRQIYPVGMSDMRLVDNRISTTWCQKQLVKSNATFNAYLLPDEPKMKPNPVSVSMVRYLDLKDDMKEYWGFYLLKGSSFTVSTCCRWPGAFLTVIRGHKQLRECAYFGDDSSEEEDELDNAGTDDGLRGKKEDDGKSNEPWLMKKVRPGVIFHASEQRDGLTKHRLSKEIVADNGNEQFNEWVPVTAKKSRLRNFSIKERTTEKPRKSTTPESGQNDAKAVSSKAVKKNESEEVFEEVLSKIMDLGDRGRTMLLKLTERLKNSREKEKSLKKREITLHSMQDELNKNDEDYDAAVEEGQEEEDENLMDEDLRGAFNKTTANDKSDSELWSSFSSSEERLINCAGLIINLPLIPKKACQPNNLEETQAKASLSNKFTYKVPSNGYYFFIFSSENEIQPNYIRVQFQFEKILYNVSNPVAVCTNTTESCSLPLDFFSWEKTVLEMPVMNNDSMWNQEFVVVSVCEPRTVIYAACVVAVPVLILLFAF